MNTYEIYFNAWRQSCYIIVIVNHHNGGESRSEIGWYTTYEDALRSIHQMDSNNHQYGIKIYG